VGESKAVLCATTVKRPAGKKKERGGVGRAGDPALGEEPVGEKGGETNPPLLRNAKKKKKRMQEQVGE